MSWEAYSALATWVYFENRRHIHASISSPSLTRCNPDAAWDDFGDTGSASDTGFP